MALFDVACGLVYLHRGCQLVLSCFRTRFLGHYPCGPCGVPGNGVALLARLVRREDAGEIAVGNDRECRPVKTLAQSGSGIRVAVVGGICPCPTGDGCSSRRVPMERKHAPALSMLRRFSSGTLQPRRSDFGPDAPSHHRDQGRGFGRCP